MVQLILSLVTNHVVLSVITGTDSQISSQVNLEIFRVTSKNARIINQIIPSAIRKPRTVTSVTNRQKRSLFHMFCRLCRTTCTLSFRKSIRFINILVAISTSCSVGIKRHHHHHHHHELDLDRPAPASSSSHFNGFPFGLQFSNILAPCCSIRQSHKHKLPSTPKTTTYVTLNNF